MSKDRQVADYSALFTRRHTLETNGLPRNRRGTGCSVGQKRKGQSAADQEGNQREADQFFSAAARAAFSRATASTNKTKNPKRVATLRIARAGDALALAESTSS